MLLAFLIMVMTVMSTASNNCSLYLAPSKVQGVGVFAGKPYTKGLHITKDPVVILETTPGDLFETWQLGHFVHDVFGKIAVSFGPTMIYNSHDDNNAIMDTAFIRYSYYLFLVQYATIITLIASAYFWILDRVVTVEKINYFGVLFLFIVIFKPFPDLTPHDQISVAHSLAPSIGFKVVKPIDVGSEIFNDYGIEYFKWHKIQMLSAPSSHTTYTLSELEQVGVCISKTFIAPSNISLAGKGVFTNIDIPSGQLVEVTPVLVHPRMNITGTQSVLMNYVIVSGDSNVTLLPYGTIGKVTI